MFRSWIFGLRFVGLELRFSDFSPLWLNLVQTNFRTDDNRIGGGSEGVIDP